MLHDAFSVLVHLTLAPLVVRVPVALPVDLQPLAQAARQRRELAWCTGCGNRAPVVRPSPLVPREPLQRAGLSLTFWEHVEVDTAATPGYAADARYAAQLHAARGAVQRNCRASPPSLTPSRAV